MPKQTGSGGFAARAGAKLVKAHEGHKSDPTNYGGGGSLPSGIEGGVALLTECKFGIYEKGDNKGKDYFYMAGTIVSPKEFIDAKGNVHRLEGKRTSKMEAMCDTPGKARATFEDHYAWMLNELRKLGLNTEEVDPSSIEETVAALAQSGVYFSFRTWQGEKQTTGPYAGKEPLVNESWEGAIENYIPAGDDGVVDETPPAKNPPAKASTAASTPSVSTGGGKSGTPPKTPPTAPDDVPFGDKLDMLADKAAAEDVEAQEALKALAMEHGVTETEIDEAADWAAVAELARAAEAGGGNASKGDVDPVALATAAEAGDQEAADQLATLATEHGISEDDYNAMGWDEAGQAVLAAMSGGGEVEDTNPKVGETHLYKPNDPKTKKPVAKAIECEIVAVDEANETVDLKNLDNGKSIYKAVPWTKLESIA